MGQVIAVELIPRESVGSCWHYLGPWLSLAQKWSTDAEGLPAIARKLNDGVLQAGVVRRGDEVLAAFTLHVSGEEHTRVLSIPSLGGRLIWTWAGELEGFLRELARRLGARKVRIAGRPAWARILKTRGFKVVRILNEMEVDQDGRVDSV